MAQKLIHKPLIKKQANKVVIKRKDGVVQGYWTKQKKAHLKQSLVKTAKLYKSLTNNGKGMSYSNPLKRGWLTPYLLGVDERTTQRWGFWADSVYSGQLVFKDKKHPIPQLYFSNPSPEGMKMLNKLVSSAHAYGISRPVETLMEWILWGLHSDMITKAPNINARLNETWYKNFNLWPLMQHPGDYWGQLLAEQGNKVGPGWFPTPIGITTMMNEMVMGGERLPWQGMNEPCAGTGIMIMPASNHTINIQAQDISLTALKGLMINSYLYIPWLVRPPTKEFLMNVKRQFPGKNKDNKPILGNPCIIHGNTLTGETYPLFPTRNNK